MNRLRRGLYLVTDGSPRQALLATVAAALRGGAVLVQYRAKGVPPERRHAEASALLELCHAHGVPLLINDDLELALAIGADGVHLGRDDTPTELARERLGAGALIGASCYADLERARAAVAAGADYVAFGSMFPSPTKPAAPPAPLALLGTARDTLGVPVCAIGGITPANAAALVSAGADLLAVISDVAAAADPEARARAYTALFTSAPAP